jgi:hypothetical protein
LGACDFPGSTGHCSEKCRRQLCAGRFIDGKNKSHIAPPPHRICIDTPVSKSVYPRQRRNSKFLEIRRSLRWHCPRKAATAYQSDGSGENEIALSEPHPTILRLMTTCCICFASWSLPLSDPQSCGRPIWPTACSADWTVLSGRSVRSLLACAERKPLRGALSVDMNSDRSADKQLRQL